VQVKANTRDLSGVQGNALALHGEIGIDKPVPRRAINDHLRIGIGQRLVRLHLEINVEVPPGGEVRLSLAGFV
jgi:hypothetical protein